MSTITTKFFWIAQFTLCALALLWLTPSQADAAIALSPSPTHAYTGGSIHFSASGGTSQGYIFSLALAPSGGTIDAVGTYTAGRLGGVVDVVEVADSGGSTATAQVSVISTLAISAPTTSIPIGTSLGLTASGGSGEGYTWTLRTAPSGAMLTSFGAYTAGRKGDVTDVVVLSDSVGNTTTASILVSSGLVLSPTAPQVAAGRSLGFTSAGGSGIGYVYTLTRNASGASLNGFGVYTAGLKAGVVDVLQVTDSYGNVKSTNIAVEAIAISPSAPKVVFGTTQGFVAAGGSGLGYSWSLTSSPSGGAINAFGVYTAGAVAGVTDTVRVEDSVGNVSTARISVVSGLVITPSTADVATGTSRGLVVAGGSGVYTWSLTSNPSGATINRFGLYVAGAISGATDIVLVEDSHGNQATASVTVTGGPEISPATPSVSLGTKLGFVASGGSGEGYTWSLAKNASGATLNAFGVYTAGALGGVTDVIEVKDSAGSRSHTNVAVTSGLEISPSSPVINQGAALGLVARGGSGEGYVWSITKNSSGAILTSFGAYSAGFVDASTYVTDTIKVIDSSGNTTSVTISVLPVLADAGEAPGGFVYGATGEAPNNSGCTASGAAPALGGGLAWLTLVVMVALRRRPPVVRDRRG